MWLLCCFFCFCVLYLLHLNKDLFDTQIVAPHVDMSEPSEDRARVKYAEAHNRALDTVTVEELGEQLSYWACHGLDMRKRGKFGQQFTRAIAHDAESLGIYNSLHDEQKEEFRKAWSLTKSFQFTRVTRTVTKGFQKKTQDAGQHLTFHQLRNKLGGFEHDEVRTQATAYVENCRKYGDILSLTIC